MERDRSHLTDPYYAGRPFHAALINDMSDLLLPNRRFWLPQPIVPWRFQNEAHGDISSPTRAPQLSANM
jgi:hypothetical protein